MTAIVLRGDARHLPMPDECVDLVVTSPPYFGLRSYTDAGEHYGGQVGSEATPAEFLEALWACTAEMVRVLKPSGSIFVNLGDKYAQDDERSRNGLGKRSTGLASGPVIAAETIKLGRRDNGGVPRKSLLGLPWRYAIGCTDRLGLILRAEIIWAKPNGLPESVTDRVRRSHEQVFHFTRQPRYYAGVDEIREPHTGTSHPQQPQTHGNTSGNGVRHRTFSPSSTLFNPLGKLPGSVWSIPSAPLTVPPHLGISHFAAFPPALVQPIILGWSPPGVCTECGEGRRPVVEGGRKGDGAKPHKAALRVASFDWTAWKQGEPHRIIGYACACTPYIDHPATGETATRRERYDLSTRPQGTYGRHQAGEYERVGPWREYHLDAWQAPPTRPAVVLDPFTGTGTTMLVASAYGRIGIGVDRSADYCRLARWRVSDPGERARARDMPKPPPVPAGMDTLFEMEVPGG